ncbi:uncharacterized protein PV06_00310 [Exophiala oligosperma]|uniref:protein-histidine N-methyltransferase n=1 Tax=Exophiala oligosperma TaxID=215243 RepID=A0A0D2B5T6_9EURO|nr:uncharacterized protein PV06_00310 [Exophiala oligosperma]KIW47631.1 hypothetical protein PV06_00310 [Exophiala oligosperma]
MSFSFGFGGDDIEDDEGNQEGQVALTGKISSCTITDKVASQAQTILPKRHSLEDLLSSIPSQISYNTLVIPNSTHQSPSSRPSGGITVQRRSLFDIRAQLMAEANPETHDAADILLSGLENGDLSSGIYEGGFKTWECSVDLASLVTSLDLSQNWHIVELGAGSAVPSLSLLNDFLTSTEDDHHRRGSKRGTLKFTLCDYNEDVLRLCTAPNVFLNHHRHSRLHHTLRNRSQTQEGAASSSNNEPVNESEGQSEDEGELDIEGLGENFINTTLDDIRSRDISFDFISGAWGDAFLDLVSSNGTSENLLILASETIYSPSTITPFTETVVKLLRRQSSGSAKAWVAAKKVYFGVGGGVDEFLSETTTRQAKSTTLLETKDTGVGRVVLEVTL